VTWEVETGLVVVHVRLTLQVLAPAAMVHDGAAGVSVPDMVGAWHTLPFQVVPEAQLAVAELCARSTLLLYRKKFAPPWGTLAEADPLLPVPTTKPVVG